MGQIGLFAAIPAETFAALRDDPAALDDYLYTETGDDPDKVHPECDFLNVGIVWHGMHFLLTGTAWGVEPPLGLVVLGGEACDESVGYGTGRFLEADRVREAASALGLFLAESVAVKYSPDDLDAAQVYPWNWRAVPSQLEEVVEWLGYLAAFYREAAEQGKAVVKCID